MARTLPIIAVVAVLGCDDQGEKGKLPLRQRWLAFAKADGVYQARADGSGMKRLTDISGFEYQPDWSPDGRKLVLRVDATEGKAGGGVYVVTVGSERSLNLRKVSHVSGGDPDWSPDGKKIAFVGKRRKDDHFGIYVMSANGSKPKRLTPTTWESQYPDWSPDGRKIVFTGVKRLSFDLYVMNVDGSDLRRLTRTPEEDNWPIWSPDGTKIVYSFGNDLRVMTADGSHSRRLTAGGEPNWSADGEWIAFDCGAGGVGRMCAIRPDGSGRTSILPEVDGGFPAWRPLPG